MTLDYYRLVRGPFETMAVTTALIQRSQEFRVIPLPKDVYEIRVKVEARHILDAAVPDAQAWPGFE